MKRLNQTESLIFMILCVICFQRQSCLTFILLFCYCMSLLVCPGESFILDSRLAIFGRKLSFWLSACSTFIVVPLLLCLGRKVLCNFIDS